MRGFFAKFFGRDAASRRKTAIMTAFQGVSFRLVEPPHWTRHVHGVPNYLNIGKVARIGGQMYMILRRPCSAGGPLDKRIACSHSGICQPRVFRANLVEAGSCLDRWQCLIIHLTIVMAIVVGGSPGALCRGLGR